GNEDSSQTSKVESTSVSTQNQSEPVNAVKKSIETEDYYSETELSDLGFRTVKLDEQRSLLCSNDSDLDCVCLEPLPCTTAGNCISFKENVGAFRTALNQKQQGLTVQCGRGETGQCGNFKYVLFNGDIHRRELRWFNNSGELVAQRNSTDYKAYCDGKARTQFMGKISKCASSVRKELICGKAETELPNAIEGLRRLDPEKYR
ncbi:MAG: hypothetical protein GXP19_07420, partial [Gammaproteobacteria bacterium]|nr:hypothetical protein [Gammaproteobacteria bacterium]